MCASVVEMLVCTVRHGQRQQDWQQVAALLRKSACNRTECYGWNGGVAWLGAGCRGGCLCCMGCNARSV